MATTSATAVLALDGEPVIPIESDLVLIETCEIEGVDGVLGLLSCQKLNKAETARFEPLGVQAHVEVLDGAALAEELHEL